MATTTITTVKDPVCGMDVNPATAAGNSEHRNQIYYFCSTTCKQKFDSDPARFFGASEAELPALVPHHATEHAPLNGDAALHFADDRA